MYSGTNPCPHAFDLHAKTVPRITTSMTGQFYAVWEIEPSDSAIARDGGDQRQSTFSGFPQWPIRAIPAVRVKTGEALRSILTTQLVWVEQNSRY